MKKEYKKSIYVTRYAYDKRRVNDEPFKKLAKLEEALIDASTWLDKTNCQDLDENILFDRNPKPSDFKLIMERCIECPVKNECLKSAMVFEENNFNRYGIFSGLLPNNRYKLKKKVDQGYDMYKEADYIRDKNYITALKRSSKK